MPRFLAILLSFFFICLKGQEPFSASYSVEDGLPSSLVYKITQDEYGYIWVCTDQGLSKFDGQQFQNYKYDEGLKDIDIYNIVNDRKGRLWINAYRTAAYLSNDSIRYMDDILSFDNIEKTYDYKFDRQGRVYITSSKLTMIIKEVEEDKWIKVTETSNMFIDENESGELLFHDEIDSELKAALPKAIKLEGCDFVSPHKSYSFLKIKNERYIISHHEVFKMTPDGCLKVELPKELSEEDRILVLNKINDDLIFLLSSSNKCYVLDSDFNIVESFKFLSDYGFHGIYEDENKSWWMSGRNGIHLWSSPSFYKDNFDLYNIKNPIFTSLCVNEENKVTAASKDGCLLSFKNGQKIAEVCLNQKGYAYEIIDIESVGSNYLLGCKNHLFLVEEDNLNVKVKSRSQFNKSLIQLGSYYNMSTKKIVQFDKDELVIRDNLKLLKFEKKDNYYSRKNILTNAIFCQHYDEQTSRYYFTNDDTLFVHDSEFKPLKILESKDYPDLFQSKIRDIVVTNGVLWLAYASGVVAEFDLESESYHAYDLIEGKYIHKLYFDEKQRLWIIHQFGLSCIQDIRNIEKESFLHLSEKTGLNTNEITDVLVVDDIVYVTSKKGINIFYFNTILRQNVPVLSLKNIEINGVQSEGFDNKLKHDENNLKFFLESISYDLNRKSELHYKLEGSFEDWRVSEFNEATFHTLPFGKYKFVAKLLDKSTNYFSNEVTLPFEIRPVWWKTLAFKICSVIGVLLLFFIWDRRRTKKIIEEANYEIQIKKKFAQLRMRTLRAQLNPHFVYNALNSIQDYVLRKENVPALRYISKFSKLMRFYLDSSSEKELSLFNELTHLEIYLELEKMRFKEKINYKIYVDPLLNTNQIFIPPMILQPFVENAILHGILPKQEGGDVDLRLIKKETGFECVISDNGVGLEKSQKLKLRKLIKRKSFGNSLVTERIKLFNKDSHKTIQLNINSTDSIEKKSGTEVVLNFSNWN